MRREIVFAISEDYAQLTGGWVYDTRLMRELELAGWSLQRMNLPAGFPQPDAAARKRTDDLLSALPDGCVVVSDQLCFCVLPDLMRKHRQRLALVTIVHHPLALESGYSTEVSGRFFRDEKDSLASSTIIISSSHPTGARLLADYGVAPGRMVVAPPGIDRLPQSAPRNTVPVRLLSVGAVVPRKGYELTLAALAELVELQWTLDIVGDLTRNEPYVTKIKAMIAGTGLSGRVHINGGLPQSELDALWQTTDVFVAGAEHEGYGMAVSEAIARGLPVVTTDAGAISTWLAPSAAIILRDRTNAAMRDALAGVIREPDLRAALSAAATKHAATFLEWRDVARIVSERLETLRG